jgi:hypothetical protein
VITCANRAIITGATHRGASCFPLTNEKEGMAMTGCCTFGEHRRVDTQLDTNVVAVLDPLGEPLEVGEFPPTGPATGASFVFSRCFGDTLQPWAFGVNR